MSDIGCCGGATGLMGTMPNMRVVCNHRGTLAFTAAIFMGASFFATGCTKPLFPESAPRTQFEKFDAMRTGAAPKDEPDVFGTPQPALRARLAPKTTES